MLTIYEALNEVTDYWCQLGYITFGSLCEGTQADVKLLYPEAGWRRHSYVLNHAWSFSDLSTETQDRILEVVLADYPDRAPMNSEAVS